MSGIISKGVNRPQVDPAKAVNDAVKSIVSFYKEREFKLYKLHKKNGVSNTEIAKVLDVTPQAVSTYYKGVK